MLLGEPSIEIGPYKSRYRQEQITDDTPTYRYQLGSVRVPAEASTDPLVWNPARFVTVASAQLPLVLEGASQVVLLLAWPRRALD